MSNPAIRVVDVGKRYRLAPARMNRTGLGGYRTLRETLTETAMDTVRELLSKRRRQGSAPDAEETHWALRGVSLDISPGEVVGIIGNNGAGKSTLLKILSRVTMPTTGRVELRGRVGTLLEVGTGFHPELTGRENIYLSGAILGMTRAEIRRKFDEIVAFAEVARHIETPVKRYSSGMYLRLAFAVAAHLEPEILLVDEVLAVGDAAFQRKCMGKMDDVAKHGRTVLFVSHNMDAIQRLCPRSVLIERGRVASYGASATVVARHLSHGTDKVGPHTWIELTASRERRGSGDARFTAVQYSSLNEAAAFQAYPDGVLEFTLALSSNSHRQVGSLAVLLSTRTGTKLINADTLSRGVLVHLREGPNTLRLRIHHLHLNPGVYVVGLWLSRSPGVILDSVPAAFELEVLPLGGQGPGSTPVADGFVPCQFDILPGPEDRHQPPGHTQ